MVRTRMFKSGNDYAIELPPGIAFDDVEVELEITRNGDAITLIPCANQPLNL